MGLGFNVIGDEAWPPFRGDFSRNACCVLMIGIVGIKKGEDGAGIPENGSSHLSRMAYLSRAPGVFPPLRPAPTSRKIGWSWVNDGTSPVTRSAPLGVRACFGISRRPPFLMLWIEPRRINRHTVEREIPIALPASSTLISELS